MREIHDHYFHKAKAEGYLARSAYKLIEIDDRKKVLVRGARVLDCGCAPGSWLQVAAERIGPKGMVVGIDLLPIRHRFDSGNVVVIEGDLTQAPAAALLKAAGDPPKPFDVVLSDMAPSTSGDHHGDHHRSLRLCEAVLALCRDVLRPGGNLAMKVFEGGEFPRLLTEVRQAFDDAKPFKPKACRSESSETYIVAHGYRRPAPDVEADAAGATPAPPRRRPAAGWETGR